MILTAIQQSPCFYPSQQNILLYNLMLSSSKIGDYRVFEDKIIGCGAYSRVYLAENSKGKKAAIKKVKKTVKDLTSYRLAKSEAKILYGLRSPHICELLGTYEEENHFYLIERYYEGKTVADLLSERKKLSYNQCLNIFKGVLKSMEYLISSRIMHRDIKPENIIFYHGRAILIDFGFACKFEKKYDKSISEKVGTPIYMSPELLKGKSYNSKSDIWSLGVILYEMIHGFPPFKGQKDSQILENILKGKELAFKESTVTQDVKELIASCLVVDADKRMSWQQLFQWQKCFNQSIEWDDKASKMVSCCFFS